MSYNSINYNYNLAGYILILIFLCLRFFSLFSPSSYNPDEIFQYSEPALFITSITNSFSNFFKNNLSSSSILYGHSSNLTGYTLDYTSIDINSSLSWEWNQDAKIRSFVNILPLMAIYKILHFFGIRSSFYYHFSIKLTNFFLTLFSDYFLFYLSHEITGSLSFSIITLLFHYFSWFGLYAFTRSLSNNLEMNFLIFGVYIIISKLKNGSKVNLSRNRLYYFLLGIIISISFFVRPTSGIFWLSLVLIYATKFKWTFIDLLVIFLAFLFLSLCIVQIDTFFYNIILRYNQQIHPDDTSVVSNSFVVTPLNFFTFNILKSKANLFGIKPKYYLFTEGIGVTLSGYIPLLFYSLYYYKRIPSDIMTLCAISFFYMICLTFVTSHYEWRFLIPCMPFFHQTIATSIFKNNHFKIRLRNNLILNFSLLIFFFNLLLAFYLLFFHQIGAENSIKYLSSNFDLYLKDKPIHLIYAAPCYSLPGLSFFSPALKLKIFKIKCLAPWSSSFLDFDLNPRIYTDELFRLEDNEKSYRQYVQEDNLLEDKLGSINSPAIFLVTFDSYLDEIFPVIEEKNCKLINSFYHTYFRYDYDSNNIKNNVIIFECKKSIENKKVAFKSKPLSIKEIHELEL